MQLKIDKTNWKKVRLGDVATEYSKRIDNPSKSKFDRFVGSSNIGQWDFRIQSWDSTDSVTSAMKLFEPNDYLLVRRSLYASDFRERAPRATFGGVCSGDILTIKENPEMVSDGFLIGILNCPSLWKYVVANASGSITRRIKWKDLANYEFLLPPKDQQAQLAELLWAMDEVIEREREVFKQLDYLFKSKAKFISDNHIHTGEYKKVKEICLIKDNLRKPINSSERDSMKGEIPYYGANGLVDYLNHYIFDEDLVLLAEDGGNFNEFYSKEIAYKISGKSWVNNHAHVLSVENSSIPIDWIYYSLVHKNILKYIIGTTRLKLNKSELENILIWIPDGSKMEKLSMEMKVTEVVRKQADSKVMNSKALKKSLINQIF